MLALIAVAYPDEHRAAEVLAALRRLQAPDSPAPGDAAVVTRRLDGHLALHQTEALFGPAGARRDLWEALVALLALAPPPASRRDSPPPLGPASRPASAGGAGGDPAPALRRLEALGVPEAFAVRLIVNLPPASSAVWLVVDTAAQAGALGLLRPFGGTVLRTDLVV